MPKPGAIPLDSVLDSIVLKDVVLPDFGILTLPNLAEKEAKDIFAEQRRKRWKGVDTVEARCDFSSSTAKLTHRGAWFISIWKKSLYGRTLSEIKADKEMIAFFADNIARQIAATLGNFLSPTDFALVSAPKRRHKVNNFAAAMAQLCADRLGLPFFDDCAIARSRHRVKAVFDPGNIPPHRNIIVVDDIVTTGSTIEAMHSMLSGLKKNTVFFAGINNKL